MIAQITGIVGAKSSTSCVVHVGGIGLRVWMSTRSLSTLPAEGDEVTLHTYLHVREEELSLFGFDTLIERDLFEKLISVSGVGPKVAVSILSSLSPQTVIDAITTGDDVRIVTVPGIGKKTAQRLIIELKDKLQESAGPAQAVRSTGASAEAAGALAAMGFNTAEVTAAFRGYDGPDDTQVLLRYALKRLGGGM